MAMALRREREPEEEVASAEPITSSESGLGLAIGMIVLGAMMMMIAGTMHFIIGLTALLDDDFYPVRPGFEFEINTTLWGWVHVVGGVVMGAAATLLFTGATWARLTALGVALLSSLWSFYSIPYYPIWSLTILAINLGLIWALVAHGKELSE
jgi:hypothetical protein